MLLRKLILPIALVSIVGCCVATSKPDGPTPRIWFVRQEADAAFYRVVTPATDEPGVCRIGVAVAVGPHTLITCSHCLIHARPWLIRCGGSLVVKGTEATPDKEPPIQTHVIQAGGNDLDAAVIRVDKELPDWLETGEPDFGQMAMIVAPDGEHDVRLDPMGSPMFRGWRPYRGSSGSPIIQRGVVVGIVEAQSPDPDDPCGRYAAVPTEWR